MDMQRKWKPGDLAMVDFKGAILAPCVIDVVGDLWISVFVTAGYFGPVISYRFVSPIQLSARPDGHAA
jgi:hypothetical protein